MASTLLAVDDSLTMRKVLEITFAGPDFRVITANTPDAALQKLKSDKPDLVVADVTLEPTNGYDLCKAIKKASPGTPVVILSSKQNAFDAAKAAACQADDHMDKPFDTQQMIDKVKKLLSAPVPGKAPAPKVDAPQAGSTQPSQPALAGGRPAAAAPAATPQRAKTLIYNPPAGGGPAAGMRAPAGIAADAPRPASPPQQTAAAAPRPAPIPAEPVREMTPAAPPVAATVQVNGQMTNKLEQLGLTPAQVDGVLALSRELIEKVVWEVVPVLAETMIKEELNRLTK